jgi:putative redox protein
METKKAYIKQIKGVTFAARADSNHWITMDGPQELEGSSAGVRPKELLMMALGGCTGSDVATILKKKKVNLTGFEMNISAKTASEHPKVYTSMHVEYVFYGDDLNPVDIERAIELSLTKYCSVTAMLKASAEITHSYRIEKHQPNGIEITR